MPNASRPCSFPLALLALASLAGCGSPAAAPGLEPPPTGGVAAPATPGGAAPATGSPASDPGAAPASDPGEAPAEGSDPPVPPVVVDPTTGVPTGVPAAQVVGQGTIAERDFIDGLAAQLKTALLMLSDAAAKGQHPELKGFVARSQSAFQDRLTQLTTWRQAWFGSAAVPEGDADITGLFTQGADYDWMWADEMTRRVQNMLELAGRANTQPVRPEVRAMAAAILKDGVTDRNQLNAWVDAWLGEVPGDPDPYAGVDL